MVCVEAAAWAWEERVKSGPVSKARAARTGAATERNIFFIVNLLGRGEAAREPQAPAPLPDLVRCLPRKGEARVWVACFRGPGAVNLARGRGGAAKAGHTSPQLPLSGGAS